jgi:transcriptional regulator of acetoin/glycerol metabolism
MLTAVRQAGGNRTKAAEELGVGRTTLYRKLHAYALKV